MNEHIDLLLTSAKVSTRNNPWTSLATHAVSSAYNISMIGYYRYQLGLAKYPNIGITDEQVAQYRRDLVKHSILLSIDIIGLIIKAGYGTKSSDY